MTRARKGYLLYFLLFGHSPQFILQCNGHFGFEKSFLLFATHITNVPKLIKFVKFWNFDFGTAFGTPIYAQTLGFCGGWPSVPKTNVFETQLKNLAPSDPLIVEDPVIKSLQVGTLKIAAISVAGKRKGDPKKHGTKSLRQ